MTTKTRTTVTVDGDGPIADALRDNADAITKGLDGDASPTTFTGAFGDQLRMFDGYQVSKVELSLGGKTKLWLSDELHAAIVKDARILDTASLTLTIGGHDLELLGSVSGRGVDWIAKGLGEKLKVKVTSSLGASGHEITDDDAGDGENTATDA